MHQQKPGPRVWTSANPAERLASRMLLSTICNNVNYVDYWVFGCDVVGVDDRHLADKPDKSGRTVA